MIQASSRSFALVISSVLLWLTLTIACSDNILSKDCSNNAYPVLGGVDFVQYFTDFKLANGSYDESKTGLKGLSSFSYNYQGYSFQFLSQSNLNLFKQSPQSYIPQWGGYCAWGIAAEFAPSWEWDADCLGPGGNWSSWTIFSEKIYFFKDNTPKSSFMVNPTYYVEQGDERWDSWFHNTTYIYNTQCY